MYPFRIGPHYRIKPEFDNKHYPWPCASDPNRTLELFADDILTKSVDYDKINPRSGYTKHTGLCCMFIQVPDDEVYFVEEPVDLVMTNFTEIAEAEQARREALSPMPGVPGLRKPSVN